MTALNTIANPLSDRSSVSQKTFAVMECVGSSGVPLTISEIATLLDMPTPTMHRIVHQLDMDGLLVQEAGSRGYVPGPRLFNFALNVFQTAVRHGSKHAILERLSAATGETCNFGIISGGSLLYADRVEASWPFGLRYEVGSRVPLHCTSMGKMLLAHQPKRRREHLLSLSDLHGYTPNTMTEMSRLEDQFSEIRGQGYSIDNQEFLAGVICAAVPVRDGRGKVCAAVAVSAPQVRMPVSVAISLVPLLLTAAEEISATWAMDEAEKVRMAMPGFKEVGEILSIIDSSSCEEFVLETQDIKLVVRRGGERTGPAENVAPGATVARSQPARSEPASAAARPTTPTAESAASASDAGAEVIRAPTVGTFYRAPSPEQSPFVEVGSKIKQGDPVCMIEVMKLFTTVHAENDGVIATIGAENGQLVEFGQVLFRMDTD